MTIFEDGYPLNRRARAESVHDRIAQVGVVKRGFLKGNVMNDFSVM